MQTDNLECDKCKLGFLSYRPLKKHKKTFMEA